MFVYVLLGWFAMALAKDLPSNFPRCHVDDAKINECLLEATKTVKPFLIKGVPELPFPSIAPFFIPKVELDQETDVLKYEATLTDVNVSGFEGYEFSKFDYDPTTYTFNITFGLNSVKIEGDYKLDGSVMRTAMNGEGKLTLTVGKTTISVDLFGELVNQNGEDYYHLKSTKSAITTSDAKIRLDGLFGGDTELSKTVHQVIDDNIDALVKELIPEVELVVDEIFLQLISNMVEDLPYSKFLPPNAQ